MTDFFSCHRATVTVAQPARCRDATLASQLFIPRVTFGFVHLTLASFPIEQHIVLPPRERAPGLGPRKAHGYCLIWLFCAADPDCKVRNPG
jgi:hypothetical protein